MKYKQKFKILGFYFFEYLDNLIFVRQTKDVEEMIFYHIYDQTITLDNIDNIDKDLFLALQQLMKDMGVIK